MEKMNLKEAIGVLKDYRRGNFVNDDKFCEAIDTVVEHCETKTCTDKEMEAFAEWATKSTWIFRLKTNTWIRVNFYKIEEVTTAQLREMWEKERREK